MSQEAISLMKTLCALRWMALMKDDHKAAAVLADNIKTAEGIA
jgi:hypothetical protein